MLNKMNILREQVSRKIVTFVEALSLAAVQLGSSSTQMGIKGAIDTLSKVRIQGQGRLGNGLILLDQQFTIPQVGEVVRDLLILDSLCLAIERSLQVDQNGNQP